MNILTIFFFKASFGGAIFINGITSINQIDSCSFDDNSSLLNGGALYLNTGSPQVKKTFKANFINIF